MAEGTDSGGGRRFRLCSLPPLRRECLRLSGDDYSPICAKLLKIYSSVVWDTWYSLTSKCGFMSSIMPKR